MSKKITNDANAILLMKQELEIQMKENESLLLELIGIRKELKHQNHLKDIGAEELHLANNELHFQAIEKAKEEIDKKELEALNDAIKIASQYSRSLIEASRDPLFAISREGKITDMNNASVEITEKSRDQLLGTDFMDYFTNPKKAREGYLEIFTHGFVADFPLVIKDGFETPVLFNGSVFMDDKGNIKGAVVVARIITEQKRFEKELTEARNFAEKATETAEIATKNAEDAVKAKQQFLSNMSHEIRTPMNAIIGFTKVVLKTEITLKQREYLNAIKISGDALIVLINDILDLAMVDSGKINFASIPFKLEDSISAMLHLFEPKIREKNLDLIIEFDPKIPKVLLGDPVRLHQIILNLVSNAVKFTNNGTLKVSVNLKKDEDKRVIIEFKVADTGIGIAKTKIEMIFENFQQASSNTSRLYGGTGLGLAIAKQLVEFQGGTILATSEIAEGSTFTVTLPFLKTEEKALLDDEIIEYNSNFKNIKVLVVEDIALNQLLMKTLLDDFGFERDIAANGKIAIEKLATNEYDIILMDLQMPEMNGFEATKYIRTILKSNIPIIALTADVTTVDIKKCMEAGMNDYIAKPLNEKLLYKKILSFVKNKELNINGFKNITTNKEEEEIRRYTDLTYLHQRTKSNATLIAEMIEAYLEQTPPLILVMKNSFQQKDWNTLHAAVHKMIPSFSIVGMSKEYEAMAQKVQQYSNALEQIEDLAGLVSTLEEACTHACKELKEELDKIKNATK
jgi:PAS domain S-box-containing protein